MNKSNELSAAPDSRRLEIAKRIAAEELTRFEAELEAKNKADQLNAANATLIQAMKKTKVLKERKQRSASLLADASANNLYNMISERKIITENKLGQVAAELNREILRNTNVRKLAIILKTVMKVIE
jgi:hypothetical protein